MEKTMATRLDESIIRRIGLLARRLGISKKAVIERAVIAYAEQFENEEELDVFARTCGAWQRDEPPSRTVQRSRCAFENSVTRHAALRDDPAGTDS